MRNIDQFYGNNMFIQKFILYNVDIMEDCVGNEN